MQAAELRTGIHARFGGRADGNWFLKISVPANVN